MRLSIENGSFAYKHAGRAVLKDVCLTAGPWDMVAILGPNGAGKTTLLRCLMGFLPWQSGKSTLDGRDIRDIPYRELWRSVSYVPQARGAAVGYTVMEMALLGRSGRVGVFARPGDADAEAARAALSRLHIAHLADKRCSALSGGELQMALIARALAAEPQILILDEPESNLDFKNQLLVLDAMSALAASGMSCVFNTHYPAHALQRANRALLLSGQGDSLFGDAHAVITEENIQSAFGVRAVIGEVETPQSVVRDVIPLEVQRATGALRAKGADAQALAVIAVIADDFAMGERINAILHEYAQYLVGRMGMPYRKFHVYIINVTMDAPVGSIEAVSARLATLPGVSVKTTYARGAEKEAT